MGEKLRKFMQRSPRYILRPQDRNDMRFSLQNTIGEGGIERTVMLNLSRTGVAFMVDRGHHPHLGEFVKVEIPIPGGEQIAWWGKVVRIEEYERSIWSFRKDPFHESSRVIVGLKFDNLPEAHSRALQKGIEQSFLQAMRDQRYRNFLYYKIFASQYFLRALMFAVLTALTVGFIYYFSQPDAKYDGKRGAPWGERFKF